MYVVRWEAGSPNVAETHTREFATREAAVAFVKELEESLAKGPNDTGVRNIELLKPRFE